MVHKSLLISISTRYVSVAGVLLSLIINQVSATPSSKIAATLGNLLQSTQEESVSDSNNYKQIFKWCQESYTQRKTYQKQYTALEKEISSKLKVEKALNRELDDELQGLNTEISETKNALHDTKSMRENEHNAYLHEQKQVAHMLSLLHKSSTSLGHDRNHKALLQTIKSILVDNKSHDTNGNKFQNLVSDEQRVLLKDFLDNKGYNSNNNDRVYSTNFEESSGSSDESSILDVVHDLIQTLENSLHQAQIQERTALEQYDSLISMKNNSLLQLQTSKDVKDASYAESEQSITQLEKSVTDANGIVQENLGFMKKVVKKICGEYSRDFASRSGIYGEIVEKLGEVEKKLMLSENGDSSSKMIQSKFGSKNRMGIKKSKKLKHHKKKKHIRKRNNMKAISFLQITTDDSELDMENPDSTQLSDDDDSTIDSVTNDSNNSENTDSISTNSSDSENSDNQQQQQELLMLQNESNTIENEQQHQIKLKQAQHDDQRSSYKKVQSLLDSMSLKIQSQSINEDKHRNWCESELSKNNAVFEEKSAKLRRLTTKLDTEKEHINDLKNSIQILDSDKKLFLKKSNDKYMEILDIEKGFWKKSMRSHEVGMQILGQSIVILQRYAALLNLNSSNNSENDNDGGLGFNSGNMNFLSNVNTVSTNVYNRLASESEISGNTKNQSSLLLVTESLNSLQTKFQQLKESIQKSQTDSKLNLNTIYKPAFTKFQSLIQTTLTYRNNLKLQAKSSISITKESQNALSKQLKTIKSYTKKLKNACKGGTESVGVKNKNNESNNIYSAREERMRQNLRALGLARDEVVFEGGEFEKSELEGEAEKMVKQIGEDADTNGDTDGDIRGDDNEDSDGGDIKPLDKSSNKPNNMLQDLQNLQELNDDENTNDEELSEGNFDDSSGGLGMMEVQESGDE